MDEQQTVGQKLQIVLVRGLAVIAGFFVLLAAVNAAVGFAEDMKVKVVQADTARKATEASLLREKRLATCSAHRYERLEIYPIGLRADLALDSCEGKICKTWAWSAVSVTSSWHEYDDAPLCGKYDGS